MKHDARYDLLEGFIEICWKLWDGVEPDAIVWDHATGQVGDPGKIHPINHLGDYFKVRGPLNTPPSPQGRPIILQAGGSPRGIEAAARVADYAFCHDRPLPMQIRQRADLDAALVGTTCRSCRTGSRWRS